MATEFNPYHLIADYIEQLKSLNTFNVPIFEIPPVMPRGDSVDIFEEGAAFGGVSQNDDFIACTTAAASAHVPSTIEKEVYRAQAAAAFSYPSQLAPGTASVKTMPPQTITWWAIKHTSGLSRESDFIELARLSPAKRKELYGLIAPNVYHSVKFIESLKGSSILWGSWGNASDAERAATGRGRGVPTNKIGHTHVVHFEEALNILEPADTQATFAEKVDYADPWTHVIMAYFANEIAAALESGLRDGQEGLSDVNVTVQSKDKPDKDSLVKTFDGFIVTLDAEVRYETILEILTRVAGMVETYYQQYLSMSDQCVLLGDDIAAQEHLKQEIMASLMKYAVPITVATAFTEMVLHIPPALPISNEATSEEETLRTLPLAVHASAWYLIEKYRFAEDGLYVQSFKIFPAFSSTKAAPERILNGVQRRPLGK